MITLYTKPDCPQCHMTYRELTKHKIPFESIDMTEDPTALEYVKGLGHSSAPVVVVDEGDSWSGFRPERIRSLVK